MPVSLKLDNQVEQFIRLTEHGQVLPAQTVNAAFTLAARIRDNKLAHREGFINDEEYSTTMDAQSNLVSFLNARYMERTDYLDELPYTTYTAVKEIVKTGGGR